MSSQTQLDIVFEQCQQAINALKDFQKYVRCSSFKELVDWAEISTLILDWENSRKEIDDLGSLIEFRNDCHLKIEFVLYNKEIFESELSTINNADSLTKANLQNWIPIIIINSFLTFFFSMLKDILPMSILLIVGLSIICVSLIIVVVNWKDVCSLIKELLRK